MYVYWNWGVCSILAVHGFMVFEGFCLSSEKRAKECFERKKRDHLVPIFRQIKFRKAEKAEDLNIDPLNIHTVIVP